MRALLVVVSVFFSSWLWADESVSAKQLLKDMAEAVHHRNFDASFVVVKGKSMEPYRWLHGNQDGTEFELLSLLNGAGLEMIRIGDKVTYFEPKSEPYTIQTDSIAGPIPEVLFKNIDSLKESYDFVLGGKGRIVDRPAQLVRLEAKDDAKYNYWLWIDTESSLLLKSAYVNQQGELLEQLQLTHISVTETPAEQLLELSQKQFPEAVSGLLKTLENGTKNNWQIGWLPQGFELLKSDRHKLDLNNELADYYLFSDGLVDISVFVQRPLPGQRPSGALSSGATTVYVHNTGAFDVSVVGNIPALTAKAIAESVKRPL
ncbi:MucB/RseB C-terminal domain-containing protein [Pseudoalteromonas piscicida]|uniref:MucB/RseB C-terminal domain-containing protein n=1 Tax=Pseudoalteromonas piscicida TaxID=43662 RepID=UPI000E35BDDE|nr:MucB/RseB C-terminal domain-containing protein [Pseudoalteromonas piscicida]AXQ97445.1 anti-sigma E factor [Pseudoalteromonas piscicida]